MSIRECKRYVRNRVLAAGEGPAVPGLPRRQILSPGAASLQASHETGQ